MLQIKTTVTRFSYVVWLGIVQRLCNCLFLYSRASLGIKGTGPLTGGVRCHTSSRVTFLVLHEGDHVWSTWSCDNLNRVVFSIENRPLMTVHGTVHRWENCNFVSEFRMFGMCIGFEARYLLFWNKSITCVRGGSTVKRASLFKSVLWVLKCCHLLFWLSFVNQHGRGVFN